MEISEKCPGGSGESPGRVLMACGNSVNQESSFVGLMFFGILLEEFVLDIAGNEFVGGELHGE